LHLANEEQKQRWLPGWLQEESWGLGLTEPGAGSDVGATAMTAFVTETITFEWHQDIHHPMAILLTST
jgi:alkylation response protein AidB-like acyl-CoA dehydrogenase